MATTATIRVAQETPCTPTLFLAFAWGVKTWQLGCTPGAAQRPRARQVPAGDCQAVLEERRRAQSRLGFPEAARVVSGDEAGREGFGLPRVFVSQGLANAVVDAARLAVHRRSRRATTERREVPKLRTRLLRQTVGAQQGWRVVRGPSVAAADRRPRHRALLPTKRDRSRVSKRRKGLLAGGGMRLGWPGEGETPREAVRQWDGAPLPTACRARLKRAWPKGQPRTEQSGSLEAERRVAWRPRAERGLEPVRP